MGDYKQIELPYMKEQEFYKDDARLITQAEFDAAVREGEEAFKKTREAYRHRFPQVYEGRYR